MKLTPRDEQEDDIETMLGEVGASDGALCANDMGHGKTLVGAEVILRGMARFGWSRILLIALPNTHDQWVECVRDQSDGTVQPLVMDGTDEGKANYAAWMKHQPGVYIAGSDYLREKDWESQLQYDATTGAPLWKMDKKTGQRELKDRPVTKEGAKKPAPRSIGPAQEPVQLRKTIRRHKFTRFARKPLDAIIFDEVQSIANRKSKTRQTILSIKAGYLAAFSGTWFLNKVENQWSIGRWVWPGYRSDGEPYVETNHSRWRERFLMQEEITGKGGKVLQSSDPHGGALKKVTGEKIPGEFASTLPCYIRRENTIKVPEPLVLEVAPLPEQKRQMEELRADLMAWVMSREGVEVPLVVELPILLRLRLRQVSIAALSIVGEWPNEQIVMDPDAEAAKLAPLRYLLEERWRGHAAAIYTESKIGAYFLAQRLRRAGASVALWTGDLSKKQRDELKAEFIGGQHQYLIATIQSIGVGVDGLQKVCNKVAWISEADGNPSANDQAIRRFRRHGFLVTDPDHPDGGFEHAKIILDDPLDKEGLQTLIDKAWAMRMALNAGQIAA